MLNSLLQTFMTPNALWVLIGAMLLGVNAGVLGCFAFLKRRALIGDTLAHAALPGVTTAFLITGSRAPLVVIIGAMLSSSLGLWCVHFLEANTKIKEDSALAMVLSFFFAIGIFQLTIIQKIPTAAQAGLDKILFGQAASLVPSDLSVLSILSVLILICVVALLDRFRMVLFDQQFAQVIGVRVWIYQGILSFLVMLSVVIGIQLVGVVLMAALMITPAAAARYWTNRFSLMLIIAGVCGALAGVFGTVVSGLAPRMPTGPWMVVAVTVIFFLSAICARERGLVPRLLRQRALGRRIAKENIVRTLFKLHESDPGRSIVLSELLHFRQLPFAGLEKIVRSLEQDGLISRGAAGVVLSESGLTLGRKITRRHRLWELYLTKHTAISSDHAHYDAEEIEHMLTPELEAQLAEEMDHPGIDPHGRSIPKSS